MRFASLRGPSCFCTSTLIPSRRTTFPGEDNSNAMKGPRQEIAMIGIYVTMDSFSFLESHMIERTEFLPDDMEPDFSLFALMPRAMEAPTI